MDTVEILVSVEQEFGIEIPEEDAATLTTPGKVIDYIMSRQQAGASNPMESIKASNSRVKRNLVREEVEKIIRDIVCDYCSPVNYREDAHFIRDLGLD